MTRRFWCNHDHVEIGTRYDLVVMNGEAVGKRQRGALLQVRLDLVTVQAALELVGSQDHNDIGSGNGGSNVIDFQTMGFGLSDRRGTGTQANGYVYARIFKIARVGMALGAVANDSDFLALNDGEVAIFIVKNFHGITPVAGRSGHSISRIRCSALCRHGKYP
ncbi:conserved hypothetical protein [Pseudomonas sp. 9Ag]|nr:conserved hypothetical protein [Pseudomonas sp. 9Ag]